MTDYVKFGVVNENLINYNQTQLLFESFVNTQRCLFIGLQIKMRDILEHWEGFPWKPNQTF